MHWYVKVLRAYAVLGGRAHRREYWMFTLVSAIVTVVAVLSDQVLGTATVIVLGYQPDVEIHFGLLELIYSFAVLVPSWAVAVRRLHDIDRSGWWVLLTFVPIVGWIVLLVFAVQDGTRGANRFGADPKAGVAQPV